MNHDHGHGHHDIEPIADRKWLTVALILILAFMTGEVAVGLIAHSLALLSDAAHMLTDAASIVLALVALKIAARPASGRFTYGFKRVEILSAQANGITLIVLASWLGYEAVRRLFDPAAVHGGPVLATALAGVVVNLLAVWSISKANRSSLNIEGAFQHILTDLFAFVATAIAGAVIVVTGFARADAIAAAIVVALMLKAGVALVSESSRIFLEVAPDGMDPTVVGDQLASRPGVVEVHDLHLWQITPGTVAMSAHILVAPDHDCHDVQYDLESVLAADFGITHTTMQVNWVTAANIQEHCNDAHGRVHRSDDQR